MTDIFEEIVSHWLFSQGYFVINNLKVGVNEIDILAVKIEKGMVVKKLHIEVQCSSNPIGYIGGNSSAKIRSKKEIEQGVNGYVHKKFYSPKIKKVVESLLGDNYDKWFICGVLKDGTTIEIFKKHQIKVKRIWEIIDEFKKAKIGDNKFCGTAQGNRYNQFLLLSEKPAGTGLAL